MAKRVWRLWAAALALAGIFAGCTPFTPSAQSINIAGTGLEDFIEPDAPEETPPGLALTVAMQGVVTTLDPALCDTWAEYTLANHLFEGLYAHREANGTVALLPAAATGHTVALQEDGTATYTFTLRADAQWSDGVQLTAGDFEYAWKRLAQALPGGKSCGPLQGILNAEQIRLGELPPTALAVNAIDDVTLAVTLAGEDEAFPERTSLPALYPVRQDAVERAEYDWSLTGPFFCGNGAYVLAGRDNEHIVLQHQAEATYAPLQITFMLTEGEDNEPPTRDAPDLYITAGGADTTVYTGWQYQISVETTEQNAAGESLAEALTLSLSAEALAAAIPGATPHANATAQDAGAAQYALGAAGYPNGTGWPEDAILLHNADDNSRALAAAITDMWQQTLGITVKPRATVPAEPEEHPVILHLEHVHNSRQPALPGQDGDIAPATIPLLAEQLAYTQSADLTHLVFTQTGGFYLGSCTLGEEEEILE